MKITRRGFLAAGAAASAYPLLAQQKDSSPRSRSSRLDSRLAEAGTKPVLDRTPFKSPVIIESVELLRKGREHFLRVRSADGAEGISVDNGRADVLHPILKRLVIPYFIGKDARDLEEHLFAVYRDSDNYKFQGLALCCPVALV